MDAPVSPQESIAGMREVIAQSGPERSGTVRPAMGCPRNSPAPVEAPGPKPPAGSARGSDRAA